MSRAAKATFAATGLGTASIIWFVHWAQEADRAVCCDFMIMIKDLTNLVPRLCTKVSSEIWRNNGSGWNVRPNLKCKRPSSRSTSSFKRYTVRTTIPVPRTKPRILGHETTQLICSCAGPCVVCPHGLESPDSRGECRLLPAMHRSLELELSDYACDVVQIF